ncbi:glycosyltransferase family 2 protein [Streptomyces sp. NPDC057557]|uniref:glycosyltransferase family 2 protein n=1 Tax=Streptomyces sp. NPDC057557 TaxID=3346167 RepID=UPI0036C8B219
MIVWINGPFGGGKSALSAELLRALPGPWSPEGKDVPHPRVHVVLLTVNNRPREERATQAALLARHDVDLRICVVGNGCTPGIVPACARTVVLMESLGIPGGRNAGARALAETELPGDYLFFLDSNAIPP